MSAVIDKSDTKDIKEAVETIALPPVIGNDHRQYRLIRLKNGLRALLIADNRATLAHARLDIDIGSSEEPTEHLGLAHFLEHMVFMGSQKFPDEGEYKQYIEAHAGVDNAYNAGTRGEHTDFYFYINHAKFKGALDRLSSFFIASLLKKDCAAREVEAVDNEFRAMLNKDESRLTFIEDLLTNPQHPRHRFSCGNKDTLKDFDKLLPELRKFHKMYYTADRMILVLNANLPLAALEKLATDHFSQIPAADKPFIKPIRPLTFLKESLGTCLQLKSVQKERLLKIKFVLTEPYTKEFSQALRYIDYMLSQESDGSLLQVLKTEGFVNDMSAANTQYSVQTGALDFTQESLIIINLPLTELGLSHIETIASRVLDYLHFIKRQGVNPAYFKELQDGYAQLFETEADTLGSSEDFIEAIRHLPLNRLLTNYRCLSSDSFPKDKILSVLSSLVPENMRLITLSEDNIPKSNLKVEPYTGAEYSNTKFSQTLLQWKPAPNLSFKLPSIGSRFQPKDSSIKPQLAQFKYPVLILNEGKCRVIISQDLDFKKPLTNTNLFFVTSFPLSTPKAEILSDIYFLMFNFEVGKQFSKDLDLINASVNLESSAKGLVLKVEGPSDKHNEIIFNMVDTLLQFRPNEKEFEEHRKTIEKNLQRFETEEPLKQCKTQLWILLNARSYGIDARKEAIKTVNFRELLDFIRNLLVDVHLEVYSHGNVTPAESIAMARTVKEKFTAFATATTTTPLLTINTFPSSLMASLPAGFNKSFAFSTPSPSNAVIVYLQPANRSMKSKQLLFLLSNIIKSEFEQQLRTKQQLAYNIKCLLEITESTWGIIFTIEAPKHSSDFLIARIEEFLNGFEDNLTKMTEEAFQMIRNSNMEVVIRSRTQPTSAENVANRFSSYISEASYLFTQDINQAKKLANITLADLREFYSNLIAVKTRRQLIVKTKATTPNPTSSLLINPSASQSPAVGTKDIPTKIETAAAKITPTTLSPEIDLETFRKSVSSYPDTFAKGEGQIRAMLEFNGPNFPAERMEAGELVEIDEEDTLEILHDTCGIQPNPVKETIIAYCYTSYRERENVENLVALATAAGKTEAAGNTENDSTKKDKPKIRLIS